MFNFSFFAAIANFTQRHIVSVSVNQLQTTQDFFSIFNHSKINGKEIPLRKRLYIIEDIDQYKSSQQQILACAVGNTKMATTTETAMPAFTPALANESVSRFDLDSRVTSLASLMTALSSTSAVVR